MSKKKKSQMLKKECQNRDGLYGPYKHCSGNRRIEVRKATKKLTNALYFYRDDCDRIKSRIKKEMIEAIDLALSLNNEEEPN